ncbi:MAG: SDR family oxidoreductase [Woeseiaceae bacterium]|nr:SDR family oxidoreductase [Woeseiaceae bacterium]
MTVFAGRRVLVTGASRGIGRAIARGFAEAGAAVAVHYRGNRDAADATLRSLIGDGHIRIAADLADPGAAMALVDETAEQLGGLDIVVNNAGIFIEHRILDCDAGDWQSAWRQILDTNLVGPASVCYAAAGIMAEQGHGKIINVSSRGAFRGEPDAPAYGASKAGLNAMSQSLAVALAPRGVFVGVVAPGFIDTDMAQASLAGEGGAAIRAQSPLGRVGRVDEVAKAVLFLASDGIDFATGAILDVNGASYLRS